MEIMKNAFTQNSLADFFDPEDPRLNNEPYELSSSDDEIATSNSKDYKWVKSSTTC